MHLVSRLTRGPFQLLGKTQSTLRCTVVFSSTRAEERNDSIKERTSMHGFHVRSNTDEIKASTPLVVLLGWAYSNVKYLRKYSDLIQQDSQCETLLVTTTLFNTVLYVSAAERKADAVLETIEQLSREHPHRPVILYSFSNGGCALYLMIMRQLFGNESTFRGRTVTVAGSIFDSCPIRPTVESLKVIQAAAVGAAPTILKPFVAPLAYLASNIGVRFVLKTNPIVQDFITLIMESPSRCPELYLYSSIDPYAPIKDIQQIAAHREELGIDVTEKLWHDSRHVEHFRQHPDKYRNLVHTFMRKITSK